MAKTAKNKKKKLTAKNADKHELYEASVQNADFDAAFLDRWFKRYRGRKAVSVKEDFCGTATFCCEWVKLDTEKIAIGVDLDRPTLDWGLDRHLAALSPEQRDRISLHCENVLDVKKPKVDLVAAFNFSYFIFKQRAALKAYFKAVYQSLNKEGLFFMDIFGGTEASEEMEEETKKKGFTYVWDHDRFDPISNELLCHIHFKFPDGTKIRKAFTYDWRLWSIPEIRELLAEVGFSSSDVLWEGTDTETESGDGVFRKKKRGESCESYIAYVVGVK